MSDRRDSTADMLSRDRLSPDKSAQNEPAGELRLDESTLDTSDPGAAASDAVVAGDPHTTAHQAGEKGQLPIDETERLIASDKVQGTSVYDRQGKNLGTVANFMVDKVSGKVAYAVLSFGGFLGIGERYHPLPWKSLSFDPEVGGYVVDLDAEKLDKAPSFTAAETPWGDPAYGRNIYEYYNVPWYM